MEIVLARSARACFRLALAMRFPAVPLRYAARRSQARRVAGGLGVLGVLSVRFLFLCLCCSSAPLPSCVSSTQRGAMPAWRRSSEHIRPITCCPQEGMQD